MDRGPFECFSETEWRGGSLSFPGPCMYVGVFTDNKYWIDLPLIPFMLIGSRLPVFANLTTWLPTLAFMPLTDTLNPRPVRFRATTRMFASRNYPPDLMMTALALPWLRIMYLACKRFVYRQLLLSRPQRPVSNANRGSRMVLMGDQPSFGVLIDSQEAAMDTYETLDDGTLVGTGLATDRDDDQVLLEDLDLYVMEHQRVPVNIFVTVESLSKLFVQALGFPLVANVAGGFLAGLARYSDVIRRWLGIAPGVVPENDLANWLKILRSGCMDPGQRRLYAAWRGQEASFMLDDLDPVWFRNLLGGGMYIVVKDMFVLLYRYLRKQQRQQLRIKDLPFSEGVARELNKAQV